MILIALAAIVAAPADCRVTTNWRSPEETAMCYFAFGSVPEQVRFRNVHTVGDYVCGEVNLPGPKRMTGYRPFAYLDRQNNVEKDGSDYIAVLNGSTTGISYGVRMREALREGNTLEAKGYQIRKADYDAKARELLSACAEQLDAD